MESKKINQLATNVNPQTSDLTTIGDPVTGQLKKITWLQVAHLIGAQASLTLQDVTNQGATTTLPITTGGLTLSNLDNGVLKVAGGVVSTYPYGQANGVASLDSGGKVPASQLPSSIMDYKGTWNAATNTPTLVNGTGDTGDVYRCNVAGTVNFGAGNITFKVGDWAIYNGTIWEQSNNSDAVSSVFGRTGDITAQEGDYNIGQLGDVTITSAATNDYLKYNGSSWVNTQFPTFVSSDKLVLQVRNNSGATINKGTVVYINGATAGYPTIAKAQADADATSAQTIGMVQDNISNNSNGVVVIVGQITGVDTSAYTAGTQLYLSGTTAGAVTSTKPYAPIHLVYIGIVTTQNAVNGVIEVKVQNGYEINEIHDISITSVANNDGLFYESSTDLWKNKSIATVLGYTPEQPLTFSAPLSRSTNTVSIPAATGSVNGYLTSTDWTTFNNKMANPMTTLGDIIFGGTSGNPNRLAGNTTTTKQYLSQTGTGTDSASPVWATITGSDITGAALTKTDDTNVTLTLGGTPATALLRAASLTLGWTGQLSVARGGTGLSALGTAGQLLRVNTGATALEYFTPTYISAAITSLNGLTAATQTFANDTNVTITSATATHTIGWSGELSIARGGTGASTKAAAFNALSPMTTLGDIIYGGASGTGTRLAGNTAASKRFLIQTGDGTNSAAPSWGSIAAGDVPTLNQNTTGSAATLTTARNFTINGTAKSFDGSANVSWTASEIGLTSYLPLTGGTLTGTLNGLSATFTGSFTVGAIGLATTPANSAGWRKIGVINSRGGGRLIISLTGGNYTPVTYIIEYYKDWTNVGTLKLEKYGTQNYITDARIRQDSADNLYYIEINCASDANGLELVVYDLKILGYNSTSTIYTGALSVGSATGTTIASASFSTSQSGITVLGRSVFGTIGGTWDGAVIGSSFGGAGTVSGILKANGSGTVSAAVAGTDYVIPSALNSYLPLAGGTLTGALNGTSANFSSSIDGVGITSSSYVGATGLRIFAIPTAQGVFLGNSAQAEAADRYACIEMVGGADGGSEIDFTVKSVDKKGRIAYENSTNVMRFETDGSSRVTISATGTVAMSAYTTNGILKVSGGNGTIGIAVAGTDYVIPSALSSYLPLSGGTLTGALSGTSATFSGDLTIDTSTFYVDSTNNRVGIGTASPTQLLTLGGASAVQMTLRSSTNTGSSEIYFGDSDAVFRGYIGYQHNGDYMQFSTAASERMRITSGGNVGIAVTPSAWGSSYRAIQIASGASFYGIVGDARYSVMGANTFANSSNADVYITTGAASLYVQGIGEHIWYNAPSGTGGTNITYSERMRITSAGIVGIGISSSFGADRLDVYNSGTYDSGTTLRAYRAQDNNSTIGYALQAIATTNGSPDGQTIYGAYIDSYNGGSATNLTTYGLYVNRGRSYFGANVGIGTTSPSTALHVVSNDGSANRTNPFNVATITATSGSAPYNGFGTGLVFAATHYNGIVYNGARIRSVLNDNSVSTLGNSIAFDVTSTRGGSLTESVRFTNDGKVGIGKTDPYSTLDVAGSIGATGVRVTSAPTVQGVYLGNSGTTSTDYATIEMVGGSSGGCEIDFTKPSTDWRGRIGYDLVSEFMWFSANAAEAMRINSAQELLIGYTSDQGSYRLQVNGSVYATAYYESSDIRLKNVLTNSYSENFSAIEFMWKDKRDDKRHWGYAAQDVMKYIPDAIEVNKDGMMTVNYNEAHTWKIAQLEAKIVELEAKFK